MENAHRSRLDPPRDLRFEVYPRDSVSSRRAEFGKVAVDSFRVVMAVVDACVPKNRIPSFFGLVRDCGI